MARRNLLAVVFLLTFTGMATAQLGTGTQTKDLKFPTIQWWDDKYPHATKEVGVIAVKGKVTLPEGWKIVSKKITVEAWSDQTQTYNGQTTVTNGVFEGGITVPSLSGIETSVYLQVTVQFGDQKPILIRSKTRTVTPK
jgi:hypothetical protein